MKYFVTHCTNGTSIMNPLTFSIYTSYELNSINNETNNTGLHTFHIIHNCH